MYNVKYTRTYERKRTKGITTIDILQDGYSGSITELITAADPLKFNIQKDVFSSTVGIGASLRVIANPTITLTDLFTSNKQEYIIKIYNGESGENLIYQGFLNPETFSENYSDRQPEIELIFNDGMTTLDLLKYENISTITNLHTIINQVISNLNTTYTGIISNNDIVVSGMTTEHLFTQLKANEYNYINEKNESDSLRKVLDDILTSMGLTMFFKADKIYIIDPLNFHSEGGRSYTKDANWTYSSTASIGGYMDISEGEVKLAGTDFTREMTPPYNEVRLVYSPYNIEGYKYEFSENITNPGTFYHEQTFINVPPNDYWYNDTIVCKDWQLLSMPTALFLSTYLASDGYESKEYYLYQDRTALHAGYSDIVKYTGYTTNIISSDGLNLNIRFSVNLNTKGFYYSRWHGGKNSEVKKCWVGFKLKIGNKYYDSNSVSWTTTPKITYFLIANEKQTDIANQFITIEKAIPIQSGTPLGSFELIITDYLSVPQGYGTTEDINNVLYKNFEFEYVDNFGNALKSEDIEYVGNIGNAINRAPNIETFHGTGNYGISRGALFNNNNLLQYDFKHLNDSGYNIIEKLVLQSYQSQYVSPRYKLNISVRTDNINDNLDLFYGLKLLRYSSYMESISMLFIGGEYSDESEYISGDFLEITSTKEDL